MDAFVAAQRDAPSRAETIRRILHEWLSAKGCMLPPGASCGTKPEELSPANDD
jgi:hypothetical protein